MRLKWKLVLSPFGDSGNHDTDRCTVCGKHTMAQKSFWTLQMVLLGDEAQVEACLGPFGDSANLDSR